MTLAEPALDEHGQTVHPADNNYVEAETVGQAAQGGSFRRRRGPRPSKNCQSDCEAKQERDRDKDGPDRHMDAKNGAANVSVSGAWKEIKQGLSRGNHQ